MTEPTSLYRLFDEDRRLLYIGIAGNPGRRFDQHAGDKPWWGEVCHAAIEHYGSREGALAAERRAIVAQRPVHNVVHNGDGDRVAKRVLAMQRKRKVDWGSDRTLETITLRLRSLRLGIGDSPRDVITAYRAAYLGTPHPDSSIRRAHDALCELGFMAERYA